MSNGKCLVALNHPPLYVFAGPMSTCFRKKLQALCIHHLWGCGWFHVYMFLIVKVTQGNNITITTKVLVSNITN